MIPIPANYTLQIQQTPDETKAMIAPTILTSQGLEPILGGNNETMISGLTTRKDTWSECTGQRGTHFSYQYKTCPVPTDKLENYRRTIVNRPDTRTLKNNFKNFQINNRNDFYKDKLGLERHGSR